MNKEQEEIIRYFMSLKEWEVEEDKFKIVAKGYKNDADKLYRLGKDVEKVKNKIKLTKKWCEDRDLEWSLGTALKKWFDNMKPKEKKKKPYYRDMRMYEKGGKWFVIPNDGGEHLEFAGDKNQITWK